MMSAERPGKVRRAAAVIAGSGADRKQRGMRRLPGAAAVPAGSGPDGKQRAIRCLLVNGCERAGGDTAWALCR